MDRRNTILHHIQRSITAACLTAMCFTVMSMTADECQAQSGVSQNVYTIVGDVAQPGSYAWPVGQPVSIQTLLARAAAIGPSGQALVRSAAQPTQAKSQAVWLEQGHSNHLSPGAVVVWRSVRGPQIKTGNIVLLTQQGTALLSIPLTGTSLSTVLQQAGLPFNQPTTAHRSSWETHLNLQMDAAQLVLHGDILDVRHAAAPQALQTPVQQQPTTVPAAAVPTQEPLAADPAQQTAGLHIPATTNTFQPTPVSSTQTFDDSGESDLIPAHPLQIPGSAGSMPTADSFQPVDVASDSAIDNPVFYQSETPAAAGEYQDASETSPTATDAIGDDELESLANAALGIDQPKKKDEAGSTFLSGLFMFGLLLAIGLITIGIVRTRQEQKLHDSMRIRDEGTGSQRSASDLSTISGTADQRSSESFTQLPAFAPDPVDETESDRETAISGLALVGKDEAKDEIEEPFWTPAETNAEELDECPVLSVGLDSAEAESGSLDDAPEEATSEEQSVETPGLRIAADPDAASEDDAGLFETEIADLPDEETWLSDDPVEVNETEAEVSSVEREPETEPVGTEEEPSIAATSDAAIDSDEHSEDADSTIEAEAATAAIEETIIETPEDPEDLILELPDVDTVRNAIDDQAVAEITEEESLLAATDESLVVDEESLEAEEASDVLVTSDAEAESLPNSGIAAIEEDFEEPITVPQTIQNQDHIMENPPTSDSDADYLEDLIQNRLPMDLTDAQLPLRINLFGKPEGPRRLRIDAAHTTIAPPHMAKSARRSRRSEPAAVAAAPVQAAVKQEAKRPVEETPKAVSEGSGLGEGIRVDGATGNSVTGGGGRAASSTTKAGQGGSQESTELDSRLDRALNFLEEQSKS